MAAKKKTRSKPRYGESAKKAVGSAVRREKKGTLRSGKAGKGGAVRAASKPLQLGCQRLGKRARRFRGRKLPDLTTARYPFAGLKQN